MSKELNLVEEAVVAIEVAVETESAKLDDLSLALVGGGNCVVTF